MFKPFIAKETLTKLHSFNNILFHKFDFPMFSSFSIYYLKSADVTSQKHIHPNHASQTNSFLMQMKNFWSECSFM